MDATISDKELQNLALCSALEWTAKVQVCYDTRPRFRRCGGPILTLGPRGISPSVVVFLLVEIHALVLR